MNRAGIDDTWMQRQIRAQQKIFAATEAITTTSDSAL